MSTIPHTTARTVSLKNRDSGNSNTSIPVTHLDRVFHEVQEEKQSFFRRWGNPKIMEHGFLAVPDVFLRNYGRLNPPITNGEAMFVLVVMNHKWTKALPFPSYKTIASTMGISDKMARRYAQRLQAKGYLRRIGRPYSTNEFDFRGLSNALYFIVCGSKQDAIRQKDIVL